MRLQERFFEIAKDLRAGKQVEPVSVRDLIGWAGAQRRGSSLVYWIRRNLEENGLTTDPDFQSAYIDSNIEFLLSESQPNDSGQEQATIADAVSTAASVPTPYADPTYRISKLAAANKTPISVPPDATLEQAVTLMLANDFSQLPVMTNERDVKGTLSWNSIGARLVLKKDGVRAKDFMDSHQEIRANSSLFQAIPMIVSHDYVLVRGVDNRITGIVTASDLSLQFQQLSEPFLLLGEIENHIRRVVGEHFTNDELVAVRDSVDVSRPINSVADLTFGEYIRLLENPGRWQQVGLAIDRVAFCAKLDQVRRIRNDVMHFDPDGIPPLDLEALRDFTRFLQRLQIIGIS